MTIMNKSQLSVIAAIHESGHAVVAIALNLPVTGVTIFDDGRGITRVAKSEEDTIDLQSRLAVVALAGGAATRLLIAGYETEGPSDRAEVDSFLELFGVSRSKIAAQLTADADALVVKHKAVIEYVAGILIKSRHLNAQEFYDAAQSA
jgi:hypothetical protein